mmetsp:Transcript_25601/g.67071  ORF Transcript_25601/g.67071 Transcript_25601/m.67071 type:complete len:212 (-) Transcript_25601:149-784(-)
MTGSAGLCEIGAPRWWAFHRISLPSELELKTVVSSWENFVPQMRCLCACHPIMNLSDRTSKICTIPSSHPATRSVVLWLKLKEHGTDVFDCTESCALVFKVLECSSMSIPVGRSNPDASPHTTSSPWLASATTRGCDSGILARPVSACVSTSNPRISPFANPMYRTVPDRESHASVVTRPGSAAPARVSIVLMSGEVHHTFRTESASTDAM